MDKEYILEKMRENKEFFQEHGAVKIGIFGSYAKGEATEESDIDVLVKMDKEKDDYFNYCYILYFLEDLFNKKIDLVNATNEELNYSVPKAREHFKKVREDILGSVVYA